MKRFGWSKMTLKCFVAVKKSWETKTVFKPGLRKWIKNQEVFSLKFQEISTGLAEGSIITGE